MIKAKFKRKDAFNDGFYALFVLFDFKHLRDFKKLNLAKIKARAYIQSDIRLLLVYERAYKRLKRLGFKNELQVMQILNDEFYKLFKKESKKARLSIDDKIAKNKEYFDSIFFD